MQHPGSGSLPARTRTHCARHVAARCTPGRRLGRTALDLDSQAQQLALTLAVAVGRSKLVAEPRTPRSGRRPSELLNHLLRVVHTRLAVGETFNLMIAGES